MKKLILSILFFSVSLFALVAQKQSLLIFEHTEGSIPYPAWVQRTLDKDAADIEIQMACFDNQCTYTLIPRNKSAEMLESADLVVPTLARHFSKKIEAAQLDYSIADSTAFEFLSHADPFGLWFFNVGGDFDFNKSWQRDRFDFNGPDTSYSNSDYALRFGASKISARWFVDFGLSSMVYYTSGEEQRSTQSIGLDIARRLGARFALGFSAGATQYRQQVMTSRWSVGGNTSIEYNFLPYESYFRKRSIVFYRIQNNVNLYKGNFSINTTLSDLGNGFQHVLGYRYSRLVPWGGLNISIDGSYRNATNRSYLSSVTKADVISMNTFLESGVNLTKSFWLSVNANVYATWSDAYFDLGSVNRRRNRYLSWSSGLLLDYFFGKSGKQVVNPRMF